MLRCPDCSHIAKTTSALLEHRRREHSGIQGANRVAAETTLTALESKLGAEHAAKLAAVRSMADALDVDPLNAQMWKEYRALLDSLIEQGADSADEALSAIAEINSATKVVHTPAA